MNIGLIYNGEVMNTDTREQAIRFGEITKQINRIYEDYARSLGLSYTSLYILHLVTLTKNCTQKYICEQMFLPKQTVNSVVTLLRKQGLLEMVELSEDRRHKAIHLADKGKDYATQIISKIDVAETRSIEQFNAEERARLLGLMERYAKVFATELKK
jgi:DNA-binding MarR family transcriptional regulator